MRQSAGFTLGSGSFDEVNRLAGGGPHEVSVTRYRADRPERRVTEPLDPADLHMAAIHLRSCGARRQWCDGRPIARPATEAGAFSLYDLRQRWSSEILHPFETINFVVPREALDILADQAGAPRIDRLIFSGWHSVDTVMLHIGLALKPALMRPEETSRLFVDQMLTAAGIHLALTYGGMVPRRRRNSAGLASWQERRVRELILDNLGRDLSLADLAGFCNLSTGHFSRAFKQSMGLTPHRWLMEQRVARAKELLAQGQELAAIAVETGFADQSHFTRVFSAHAGHSPGAWRRMRRS